MSLDQTAPPTPYRTRQVRPTFYRSELTGSLPPDCRDLLLGLTTMADDEGWILWRPAELAATIYGYQSASRRLRDLERRAQRLIDAGLVILKECGCAFLPTLKEHHGHKGGEKTTAVWNWHMRHPSVGLRSATDESVSSSVSDSSSYSDSDSGSSSPGARANEDAAPNEGAAPLAASLTCDWCHQPTTNHSMKCPSAPHLRAVG